MSVVQWTMYILTHIIPAFFIGVSAGISPGPLSVLILSEAASGRYLHSIAAAFSPLVSDGPIACAALLFLSLLPDASRIYGVLYSFGGMYLFFLSYKTAAAVKRPVQKSFRDIHVSLLKGASVNLLNPNPYIFWITIGGPSVKLLAGSSFVSAVLYIVFFYTGLIGTKCAVACAGIITSKTRIAAEKFPVKYLFGVLLSAYGCYFLFRSVRILFAA